MGETVAPIRISFNQSLQIEGRSEKLTAETGALLLREADEKLGLIDSLAASITDKRKGPIEHTITELLRTSLILPALGWWDQDDADFFSP